MHIAGGTTVGRRAKTYSKGCVLLADALWMGVYFPIRFDFARGRSVGEVDYGEPSIHQALHSTSMRH